MMQIQNDTMSRRRLIGTAAGTAGTLAMLAGTRNAPAAARTLRVGFVSPRTGALA